MKKLIIVLILMAVIVPVFAQNNTTSESKAYYINVPVERIYPSAQGYIIQYRRNATLTLGTIGIPNEWFTDAGGRAEIMKLPRGTNWPSMSIFYNDGEFSHVRLYVHRSKAHVTWGSIPMGIDVSRHFSEPDTFNIQY
ncbi:MAG: hypothetical protein LBU66_09135 [Treponema sp.]|jgi:hypothetical protein|nr:hypothetical protein [Treponema sp.]